MSIWDEFDKGEEISNGLHGKIYKCQNKETKKYEAIKEIVKDEKNKKYLNMIEEMNDKKKEDNSFKKKDIKDYIYVIFNLEESFQIKYNDLLYHQVKEFLIQINNILKIIDIKNSEPNKKNIISFNIKNYPLIKLSYFSSNNDSCLEAMAPEIIDKEKDLTKRDLWSIGIFIYYLYFKQYPFNGKNESELINDIYSDKLLNKIDNEELDDLMNKLLKKNINERISWDEYFNHPFFKIEEKEKEKDLIHLPLFKTYTYILKNHNKWVYCLTLLNDGRLVSGSDDNSIIIYNKKNYEPDIIINEHNSWINCLITLKNGILVSCSNDKTIKLFDIKEKEYKEIQTLDLHTQPVNTIRELSNNYLVSGSDDKTIIFYIKDNEEYKKYDSIDTSDWVRNIIQIKENEIAYSTYNEKKIYSYDLVKKTQNKLIKDDIICSHNSLFMIRKDLLLVPGLDKINIININEHKIIQNIEINEGMIYGVCMLNSNSFITGGENRKLRLLKLDINEFKSISLNEENVHEKTIFAVLNLNNGHIATASEDKTIKIW